MEKTILNLINKTSLLLTLGREQLIYWGRFGWDGGALVSPCSHRQTRARALPQLQGGP